VTIRTQAGRILVLASLILSVAVLSAPQAQAQEGQTGPVCVEGTFDGTNCVIAGEPPAAGGLECPVSDTVIEDGAECYTPVDPELFCVGLAVPVETPEECVDILPADPGAFACDDGGQLNDALECVVTSDPVLTCQIGFVDGDECREIVEAIEGPPTCPVSEGEVFFEDGLCFTLVDAVIGPCPFDFTENEVGECTLLTEGEPVFECEVATDVLIDDTCVRGEAQVLICDQGEVVGELCVENIGPGVNGPPSCPVSDTVFGDVDDCFTLVDRDEDGLCPPGTVSNGDAGNCRRPAALVPGALQCPGDALLILGECFDVLRNRPRCENGGVINNDLCLLLFDAIPLPPVCPVGSVPVGDLCEITTPRPAECPPGSTESAQFAECVLPVDLAPGQLTCPDGFIFTGLDCERVTPATLTCAAGELIDGVCVSMYPAAQLPATCPEGSVDVGDDLCEIPAEPERTCPFDAPEDAQGVCRLPVDLVPTTEGCAPDFGLVDGECIQFAPPIYLCAGLEVTINMLTGDTGRGTNGDDVILGTDGRDFIRGRGGNDVICAGGGNDFVSAGGGNDVVFGADGRDTLIGSRGNDTMSGGAGFDRVFGGSGDDILDGGDGTDWIFGGRGDDALSGGTDFDWCLGNGGSDTADDTCEVAISAS